jgi:ubiquinone/menaquinone biosynthesis C-methylase UbiE
VPAFPDHFSKVAEGYSEFRPGYPSDLFDALATMVRQSNTGNHARPADKPERAVVWDCAAGTGQASLALGERFEQVIATDASVSQVRRAEPHPHVQYLAATAEHSPLAPNSVSLLTVAQALHWFNVDAFYREANRVLRPDGIIAVWCYGLLRVDANRDVERAIDHFTEVTVGPWWPHERAHVDSGYTSLPFPFSRMPIEPVNMTARWRRQQLLGYLRTWSAVSRMRTETGTDPVSAFEPILAEAWGGHDTLPLQWPLSILVGRPMGQ